MRGSHDTQARVNTLPADSRGGQTIVLTPVNTAAIPEAARAGMSQFAMLLSVTVGLLLLIAGLTVGMLLLIRARESSRANSQCASLSAPAAGGSLPASRLRGCCWRFPAPPLPSLSHGRSFTH